MSLARGERNSLPATAGKAVVSPMQPHLCELSSPPKPKLAFRVGIVGHRPQKLTRAGADAEQLGHVIHQILATIHDEVLKFGKEHTELFNADQPILRAVSPLAEGADRIFARQALDLEYRLCCPLPFLQAEFEKDFKEPGALEEFRELLDQADTVFQLESVRRGNGSEYAACGHVVVNQSDLLIAVWDGIEDGKNGGTESSMREAVRYGVPVLCINAFTPHVWRWKPETLHQPADEQALRSIVRSSIAVPEPKLPAKHSGRRPPGQCDELSIFYKERRPAADISILWTLFRDFLGGPVFTAPAIRCKPYEAAVLNDWPADRSGPVESIADELRPYYAWPDGLSGLFANRYRSTFILVYILAALAVGCALIPLGWEISSHAVERSFNYLELSFIGLILALVTLGHWFRWHERFINYRLAAELVRHLRVVAPVGGERPFVQVPAHHAAYGHPSSTWMSWYVRAIARSTGLPHVELDTPYLIDYCDHLSSLVAGQLTHHEKNTKRSGNIEQRLHYGVITLLVLTLGCCLMHLFVPPEWGPYLSFSCGFLPAMGAALAGIGNFGEFKRLEKRSHAMHEQLAEVQLRLNKLKKALMDGALLTPAASVSVVAEDVARLLVQEVMDWRIVFLDRSLELEV